MRHASRNRRHRYCRLTTCSAFALLLLPCQAAAPISARPDSAIPAILRICGDDSDWWPYTYSMSGPSKQHATGYSVEYLLQLLRRAGHDGEVTLLPWKRCVAMGLNGEYDIVLDVARSPERQQQFLFPRPHYAITPVYLYNAQRGKPELHTPEDFARFQICQQAGYAYDSVIPKTALLKVNADAQSLEAAFKMLENGRCDVLLNNSEIIDSYLASGRLPALANGTIQMERMALPEPLAVELHAGVSSAVPYRHELVKLIDQGIAELQGSDTVRALQQRYLQQ